MDMDRSWTPDELLELVGRPRFRAGERFDWSHTNYLLVGQVAEQAGGAPLEQQLRQRIFEPLGLSRTFLSSHEEIEGPIAHGYGRFELNGDLYDDSRRLPNTALATAAWASGGLASTPSDVARWLYLLRSGAVLGEEWTTQMFDFSSGADYTLGIQRPSFPGAADSSPWRSSATATSWSSVPTATLTTSSWCCSIWPRWRAAVNVWPLPRRAFPRRSEKAVKLFADVRQFAAELLALGPSSQRAAARPAAVA